MVTTVYIQLWVLILNVLMINIVWMKEMCMQHGDMCEKNEDVIRVRMQVKELVDMRDKYIHGVLNRGECSEIIECLCTE